MMGSLVRRRVHWLEGGLDDRFICSVDASKEEEERV